MAQEPGKDERNRWGASACEAANNLKLRQLDHRITSIVQGVAPYTYGEQSTHKSLYVKQRLGNAIENG